MSGTGGCLMAHRIGIMNLNGSDNVIGDPERERYASRF